MSDVEDQLTGVERHLLDMCEEGVKRYMEGSARLGGPPLDPNLPRLLLDTHKALLAHFVAIQKDKPDEEYATPEAALLAMKTEVMRLEQIVRSRRKLDEARAEVDGTA